MRRNNINMGTMARRLAVCCLLLWSFAGQMMAQTDKPYVIKKRVNSWDYNNSYGAVHYLAHVKSGGTWVLQDATTFNPETCIWYSGPVFNVSGSHHNYYFYDEEADKYHFLSAPLAAHQSLGLSDDLPSTSQLKNPDEIYYFYDWDWDHNFDSPKDGAGVARGHIDNGWWTVHYVEFDSTGTNQWRTSIDQYHITYQSARFREVAINSHPKQITSADPTSGLGELTSGNPLAPITEASMNYDESLGLSATVSNYFYNYIPAYTQYTFHEIHLPVDSSFVDLNYYFPGNNNNPEEAPVEQDGSGVPATYEWTISGDAVQYLSFESGNDVNTLTGSITPGATSLSTNIYYRIDNPTGNKTATLKLKVTYSDESTQERTVVITAVTSCQNPQQAAAPVINYNDVTVSWYPTATKYKVEWKKASETNWSNSVEVGNVTSYTFIGLDEDEYDYRVIAYCGDAYLNPPAHTVYPYTFKPGAAPSLLIYGSVFGGGRAANVTQKTEVVIVNCDSIGAVYGGNDIAGSAGGDDGSVITIGVDGTGIGTTSAPIRIGSVYGGGNGYYAYGSTTFTQATSSTSTIPAGDTVYAMSPSGQWTDSVWVNSSDNAVSKPTLTKTAITVTNDYVRVDSLFGGAKNAFVTNDDINGVNTTDTIKGGTIFAVFGGNNVGGTLAAAKQSIYVTNTKTNINTTKGLGRTHGIGYLFGGGNLVAGTTTAVTITGGQLDTIFGGGNRASVNEAHLTVNCTGNKRITAAQFDDNGNVTNNYGWDGDTIYNVHTLFGGNNRAHMNGVPYITLTSGGVGTAYGGGNAGDMLAEVQQYLDDTLVKISTHMQLNSDNMIVDNLYGGCQMSNVACCTWVEIMDGRVGTVYGGCNVSGDVGSAGLDPTQDPFIGEGQNQTPNIEYQKVKGATYVKVSGGNVYRDVYAGSNGYYHCNDGIKYVAGMDYGDPDGSPAAYDPEGLYIGLPVPTHNATNVKVSGGRIRGNVYAGGNLACVGFTDYTVPEAHVSGDSRFPQFVGLAFVEMSMGTVDGDVYGGGKMASVFGSNSVTVSGGHIGGALYGGNDRTGQVAQITNRVLPDSYSKASDDYTDLNQLNVKTYVRVTDSANVKTVYGGGNGDYIYDLSNPAHIQYCGITPDEPIQSNTFVDIDINGQDDLSHNVLKGHIGTVYGGGNGVTVINGITVFLNVKNPDYTHDNVDTIFGGNNKGSLTLVPDIILREGQVNTVYGGCNKGAMYGDYTFTTGDSTYRHVGSLVRLRDVYNTYNNAIDPDHTNPTSTTNPTARVSGAVYGGCRMNGVTNNSMVIVEGNSSDHVNAELFGGSDISGVVGGTSMVVVNGTDVTKVGNAYGGGNGHYDYVGNKVYKAGMAHTDANLVATDTATVVAPYCAASRVDMLNGTCVTGHNIYAGGYAALSGATMMNIVGDTVYDKAFGGGNLAGTTTKNYTFAGNTYSGDGSSTVNVTGGVVKGGVYGGNNLADTIVGAIQVNILSGKFGTSTSAPMTDGIFGGGYGSQTRTTGNVTVTVDKISGQDAPLIYGDVYGGSGYGDVNSPMTNGQSDDITTVNIFEGTINGDIYGGGLGDTIWPIATGHYNYPAHVNGRVYVNVGSGGMNGNCPQAISGNATINGSVYGCNNVYGTPLDSVFVNIYRTAHGNTPQTNAYPVNIAQAFDDGETGFADDTIVSIADLGVNIKPLDQGGQGQAFALRAVYGGGNKAAYLPPLTAAGKPRCATVHVWGCQENTIEDVYGGGNAADVGTTGTHGIPANTRVIIDGGRIHRMFGGGNGFSEYKNHDKPYLNTDNQCVIETTDAICTDYNPGANIYGTASSYVYAGLIDEVYGGANQWGSIDTINLNVLSSDCCEDAAYGKVFGCANEAPINHDIVTTVGCDVGEIGELYGGSNLADIGSSTSPHPANVTLNVYDGDYLNVFGGSKGDRTAGTHADIYGNVTLNIYGGTIVKAFGGSDQLGNVFGAITVNVDTTNSGCHPMVLDTVFGAGNLTYYTPNTVDGNLITSPIVNIKNGTVRQAVFGGGLGVTAITTANPQVNIGDTTSSVDVKIARVGYMVNNGGNISYVGGDVYGGGYAGDVKGAPEVNILKQNTVVYNEVYGGGDFASIDSTFTTKVNVVDGTIKKAVYGGCHNTGNVRGDIEVNIYGGTLGTSTENITIHGGGLGQPTTTTGNVTVNIGGGDYTPTIYGNVYGGSALGKVNNISEHSNRLTKVDLKTGTVHGTVYGGGLGIVNQIPAWVYGNVEVYANGATVDTIFGCNDQNGAPTGTVTVTVNDGIVGYVFGGGDLAHYTAPASSGSNILYSPYVVTYGGQVNDMILGGGNAANIYGNTKVELLGGTIGKEGSATVAGHPAKVFGGGLGNGTQVRGQVLVNFGEIDQENPLSHTDPEDLILYGDLYGGSALGDVNTPNGTDSTTVNILNGTIASYHDRTSHNEDTLINSRVFGGGLGQQAASGVSEIVSKVYGKVHVNIGTPAVSSTVGSTGQADLVGCDVFGCNNQNGSPQKEVYVDVYQTYHIQKDSVDYMESDATYAISQVFGGGNESNYMINDKITKVYVHNCTNTVERVFGGGNAADVYGVDLWIDGGRFDWVFGGGNGERGPEYAANIGGGNVHLHTGGGIINYLVGGSNLNGTVNQIYEETYTGPCNVSDVGNYFLGSNSDTIFGDVNATIDCELHPMKYRNLYCGSNLAPIYGNIKVTINGGIFENVFGGSKGRKDDPNGLPDYASNIKDYTAAYIAAANNAAHWDSLAAGDGGHVKLVIHGGTIGDLFGGCDENGNIEGSISITVDSIGGTECPMFIGNIYGGGNKTNYTPTYANIINGTVRSPLINVIKGTIGGKTNKLPVHNPNPSHPDTTYAGNVFGGGNMGNVTCHPKVIIGVPGNTSPVTIKGSVFGGGNEGNLNGSPVVVVVPSAYTFSVGTPTNGNIIVTNRSGGTVNSGVDIAEGQELTIRAVPANGYKFTGWTVTDGNGTNGNGSILNPNSANTTFIMGSKNTSITATFVPQH